MSLQDTVRATTATVAQLTTTALHQRPKDATISAGGPNRSNVRLESLAIELRIAIICQVEGLEDLKHLVLSSPAYYHAYREARKDILLTLAMRAHDSDGIDLSLPQMVLKAREVDHLAPDYRRMVTNLLLHEKVTAFSKQDAIDTSAEQCMRLLHLQQDASQVCDDLPGITLACNPITGEAESNCRPLSKLERSRITRSIYKWELWRQLFWDNIVDVYGTEKQRKEAEISPSEQCELFLARYPIWEQEQLGCICDYASRRYERLFDEAAAWLRSTMPPDYDPSDNEDDDWNLLSAEATWGFRPPSRDDLVNQGPRLLATLLRIDDPKERCDAMTNHLSNRGAYAFRDMFKLEHDEHRTYGPNIPHIGEVPVGWQWARFDWKGDVDDEAIMGAQTNLWDWGYVFWDKDRLRAWGIEPGGDLMYCDEPFEPGHFGGIRQRNNGKRLQRRPSVSDIWEW